MLACTGAGRWCYSMELRPAGRSNQKCANLRFALDVLPLIELGCPCRLLSSTRPWRRRTNYLSGQSVNCRQTVRSRKARSVWSPTKFHPCLLIDVILDVQIDLAAAIETAVRQFPPCIFLQLIGDNATLSRAVASDRPWLCRHTSWKRRGLRTLSS